VYVGRANSQLLDAESFGPLPALHRSTNTLAELYVSHLLRKLYHQRFTSDESSVKVQSILTKTCSLRC